MLFILDKNYRRQYIIQNVITAERYKQINGDNTLSLEVVLDSKGASYFTEDAIIEENDDYFDVVLLNKSKHEDGTTTVKMEAEHVSYRLNDEQYDVEEFTETGSPNVIFNKILSGTGFTNAGVSITRNVTYSAQEKKSRRELLLEFAVASDAEVIFHKFTMRLVDKMGTRDYRLFTTGKNVSVINHEVDRREKDKDGKNKVTYTCTSVVIENYSVDIGDDILLVQRELNLKEKLRIIAYRYNPYNPYSTTLEIGNFVSALEDTVYKIETGTVAKENLYNGCKIGPDEGFVAEARNKNDPTRYVFARTIMNATEGISIYSSSGDNKGLEKNFYVDMDGKIHAKELEISGESTFKGLVTASEIKSSTIEASSFIGGSIKIGEKESGYGEYNFTVNSLGAMTATSGYFEGSINASVIEGTEIYSSTIDVDEDAGIGNHLYIGGGTGSGFSKGVEIEHGGNTAKIYVDRYGEMNFWSWGSIVLHSAGDVQISSSGDITLWGDTTIDGFEAIMDVTNFEVRSDWAEINSNTIILDGYSYLWDNSSDDNRIATWEDIDDSIAEMAMMMLEVF